MASIIERVELARQRVLETPSPAVVQPLMDLVIAAPEQATPQHSGEATTGVASGPHPAINPIFAADQPDQSITRGGGGRGGARGGRGRGGGGADNRRGQAVRHWQAERPVRCSNETPPGTSCSYVELGTLTSGPSVPLTNNPPNSPRGGQGYKGRGRGQGYRPRHGRKF